MSLEVDRLTKECDKVKEKHVIVERNGKCTLKMEKLKIQNVVLKSSLNDSKETIAKFAEWEKNLKILLGR